MIFAMTLKITLLVIYLLLLFVWMIIVVFIYRGIGNLWTVISRASQA